MARKKTSKGVASKAAHLDDRFKAALVNLYHAYTIFLNLSKEIESVSMSVLSQAESAKTQSQIKRKMVSRIKKCAKMRVKNGWELK